MPHGTSLLEVRAALLTAAGYPWTVVPVERRDAYMTALEQASAGREIGPFADFLAELVVSNLPARSGSAAGTGG